MNTTKIIKIFILAALVILSTAIFWKGLADIYLKGNLSTNSLIWFAASLLAFVIFLLFFSLLVEKKPIVLFIFLLSLMTFFIFFPFQQWFLIGLAALFLIFIANRALMQKERKDRLKISLRAIFKKGLMLVLIFLALFLGLLAYFYPLIKIDDRGINLPPQVLTWLIKPLSGMMSKVLPVFNPEMTIDEILAMTVVMQKPDLSALSPEILKKFQGKKTTEINPQELLKDQKIIEILKSQAKKVNTQTITAQRNELTKKLGIELKGDEKITEVINKLASQQLQGLLGPYLKYLPIISAVLTFLILTIIFVPFSWLVILVALFIFIVLKIFRFVKIEKVMKEGEDISI